MAFIPKYAISDPEGFNLYSLLNPLCDKTAPIVVCGDLIDSTMIINNDTLKKLKSFNLFNIHEVIKPNSNVILTLGNRDLNKIKCRYLCKLDETVFNARKDLVNQFNNGTIDLSVNNCNLLTQGCANEVMPWTHKMKNWYTFWNPGNPNPIRDFKEFDNNYCKENDMFHKRFVDIFGADGGKGTMSADKLLETIPYELFGEYYSINPTIFTNNYKAFIVLAVFKSMMINEIPKFDAKFDNSGVFVKNPPTTTINTSLFKGWLCKMYEKSVMCLASVVKDNIFLFSHAGMPVEEGILNKLREHSQSKLTEQTTNGILTDISKRTLSKETKDKRWLLSGGTPVLDDSQKLTNIVEKYNMYFKDILITPIVVNNDGSSEGIPTDIMIQLLAYTSGYSNETKKYSSASGPVNLIDYWKVTKNHYSISDKKVHQIHGHSPQGFGCDITPLIDEYDKFYGSIVNLDNSNTFMSNNRRQYGDDSINKQSYNYLKIDDDGEYEIDTSLRIDVDKVTNRTIIDLETDDLKKTNINIEDQYTPQEINTYGWTFQITFKSKHHLDTKYIQYYKNIAAYTDIFFKKNKPPKTEFLTFSGFLMDNHTQNNTHIEAAELKKRQADMVQFSLEKIEELKQDPETVKKEGQEYLNGNKVLDKQQPQSTESVVLMRPIGYQALNIVIFNETDLSTKLSTYSSGGGYSRRNRRITNLIQRNRNSKRRYLTTTRKSRNQQKQNKNKNRKCTCANCRSMRR
jgi:hypothetical protein